MLFDGWALHLSPPPDHIEGHPFHAGNNVNGIAAESIDDLQVLPLDPRVEAIEEAYIRKVVDTLHDLPNVLWEVANESTGDGSVDAGVRRVPRAWTSLPSWGDSTAVAVLGHRRRQATTRRRTATTPHPIGMTMQFPVADQTRVNEPLLASRADWISPGYDDERFAERRPPDGAGLAAVPLVRRSAAGRRRARWSSATPTTTRPARATRCGRGSRSCAATTRS